MSILEKYSAALKNKDEAAMNELLHDDFKFKMHKSGNTLGIPKVFPDLCILNLKSSCKSSFIAASSLFFNAALYFSNIDILSPLYSFNYHSIRICVI